MGDGTRSYLLRRAQTLQAEKEMLTRDVQELRALLEESGRETRLKRIRELEAENKRLEYRVEQLEGELVEVKQDWSVLRDKLLSLGYMRG